MMPDALGWFTCGAVFSALLFGWPWHHRFSRYSRSNRYRAGEDSNGNCVPLPPAPPPPKGWINTRYGYRPPGDPACQLLTPPPDVAAAINRQLDRDIAVELNRRRQQRRGSNPSPPGDNPSPPLLSKPTKHELFQVLIQSGGATRCVSIEWLEPFAHAVLERWGR
jgi:hypothetical protein